jgi:hypothetical protein
MATKSFNTRIQLKHDFEINWNDATFIPLPGELIIYDKEIDLASGNIMQTKRSGQMVPVVPITDSNGNVTRSTAYIYDRFKVGDGKTPIYGLGFITASIEENIQNNSISCGTQDPDVNTSSKFYFKYSE